MAREDDPVSTVILGSKDAREIPAGQGKRDVHVRATRVAMRRIGSHVDSPTGVAVPTHPASYPGPAIDVRIQRDDAALDARAFGSRERVVHLLESTAQAGITSGEAARNATPAREQAKIKGFGVLVERWDRLCHAPRLELGAVELSEIIDQATHRRVGHDERLSLEEVGPDPQPTRERAEWWPSVGHRFARRFEQPPNDPTQPVTERVDDAMRSLHCLA